jgi:hypothetical protein
MSGFDHRPTEIRKASQMAHAAAETGRLEYAPRRRERATSRARRSEETRATIPPIGIRMRLGRLVRVQPFRNGQDFWWCGATSLTDRKPEGHLTVSTLPKRRCVITCAEKEPAGRKEYCPARDRIHEQDLPSYPGDKDRGVPMSKNH